MLVEKLKARKYHVQMYGNKIQVESKSVPNVIS